MRRSSAALRGFKGLPHRVEKIAAIDGITFYDDSKGTNVGSTVAALNGFTQPVVLIAGGDGKGQDFRPLREPVKRRARAVVLIGRDREQIAAAIAGSGVPLVRAARHGRGGSTRAGREPRRRRSVAVAGMRELRHVQELRAPRRRICRRGEKRGGAWRTLARSFIADVKSRPPPAEFDRALVWSAAALLGTRPGDGLFVVDRDGRSKPRQRPPADLLPDAARRVSRAQHFVGDARVPTFRPVRGNRRRRTCS